ncbi:unnamed protein product [Caenorhabditis angaria]|uniref:Uncharacterized protein n=1 Tax=Caenorhabditis angaria TaxID=860376 RepID=A0A9P1ITC5_9PELO|nr:unnamed protein product [Caenorhabditis angaria]
MESYIQNLPKEYATELQEKIQDFKRSNGRNSALGDKIVYLIFDCLKKHPDTFWDLSKIFRYALNDGCRKLKLPMQNNIDKIVFDIRYSDSVRCLKDDDENWNKMKFIVNISNDSGFWEKQYVYKIISDLFQSISCNCKNKYDGNICDNTACVDNHVSQKQFDEFQLKSEYPIQCGILYLEEVRKLTKNILFLSISTYWLKRLRKLWRCFGEQTQEMIENVLKQYNLNLYEEIELLKKNHKEEIENEKLEYEKNIEELNRENATLKNEIEQWKKNEEQMKSKHSTKTAELQKVIQELNQKVEKIVELKNKKQDDQKNIEELNRENEILKKKLEKSEDQIRAINVTRTKEFSDEKLKLQKIIQNLNRKNVELKNNAEKINTEFNEEKFKHQENYAKMNRENVQLKNYIEKLKAENAVRITELEYQKNATSKKGENHEIVENLMADNDRLTIECVELKSQLKQEGIQIMDFKFRIEELEKTIENQASDSKNAFKMRIKCPNIRRIYEKYEKILISDMNLLYPKILSNMDKLVQIHPRSKEILKMQMEILEFDDGEKIEEYLRRINEDYWKIMRNPGISMKELGEEIETIPSDEFMEKYQKLIEENNLEP